MVQSKKSSCYLFARSGWGKDSQRKQPKRALKSKKNQYVKTIYASADPDNPDSTKILEKNGFKFIEMRWFEATNILFGKQSNC